MRLTLTDEQRARMGPQKIVSSKRADGGYDLTLGCGHVVWCVFLFPAPHDEMPCAQCVKEVLEEAKAAARRRPPEEGDLCTK